MIDIHTHILPELDDGAKDWEESLAMAKDAAEKGIRIIIATPHHMNGVYNNDRNIIIEKVSLLNSLIKNQGIDLKILPGAEVRIYDRFVQDLKIGKTLTLNDKHKHIFVEFPYDLIPLGAEQLIFDIQVAGFVPIIPHPERNRAFLNNPGKLYQLVKKGAVTQITAASLLGKFGKDIQTFSAEMIEHNLTHFIASDTHGVNKRGNKLAEAYEYLEKQFGTITANYFKDNARRIIDGKDIYADMPYRIERKKRLFSFLKKNAN